MYDWDCTNGELVRGGAPWAPKRLVDLAGIDYFGHVTFVILPDATDAITEEIGRLLPNYKCCRSMDRR